MSVRRLCATALTASLALAAGCATGPYDNRDPWELRVEASPVGDDLVHVRTYTLAPTSCYAPGEIRSAPATEVRSIQLQAVIEDTGLRCGDVLTPVVHDLPGLRIEPDDDYLEVVISADGVERNRVLIALDEAPPVEAGYALVPYAYRD